MALDNALRRTTAVLVFVGLAAGLTSAAGAENWPQWRGPKNNGVSTEKNIPTEWSREKNVAWRAELPGAAGATPVVWEDRIFVTSVDGQDLLLLCFNTDGQEQWRMRVGRGNKTARGDEGNSAAPSPVTDGKHVWAFMGNGSLGCYTLDGVEVWNFNVQDRYGKFHIQFGMTSTPVVDNNRLYLQLIHGDMKTPASGEALVVALDALTGDEIWKRVRKSDAYAENKHSYASPILYDFNGLKYLITHGADYTIGHRLQDGREMWRVLGINPQNDENRRYHPTLRLVASPAAAPGIIVIPSAKNGPVIAIRPDGKGAVDQNHSAHLWTINENTPDVPSPLIHDGLVYLCRENGNLLCLEAETGKEVYFERTHRLRHRASPVYADGKIYLTARDGKVTVVKAGREFEILAQNDTGEDMAASPVISNGTIYLRTFDALWAIREK